MSEEQGQDHGSSSFRRTFKARNVAVILRYSFEFMRSPTNPKAFWLTLGLAAAIPRILGAFFLPNAFGDAYVYIRDIGTLSLKLSARTFSINDLYGFWLPLYQFICAVINVFVGNGFYVGKLVSAVFGVGVCLLVYGITLRLTANRTAALLAFVLITFNPLHIFYSASAMTDVPHAFFVLASLYLCLKQRWVLGAALAALAGWTRMESWMFILLIPAMQFIKERRISLLAIAILLLPPLTWLYISWRATGDPLACFQSRRQYHDWLMSANPTLQHFSLPHVISDSAMLLVSTDFAVMVGCFAAGWFVTKAVLQKPERGGDLNKQPYTKAEWLLAEHRAIVPGLILFFAFLSMIVVAYVTGTQPIIFPRYGLILFTLGIPILAWTVLALIKQRPESRRRLLSLVFATCVLNAGVQAVALAGSLNQMSVQRAVADYLRDHYQSASNTRILCDEGTVIVMSGIPPEKFVSSSDAPNDREGFVAFLKEKNAEYLVVVIDQDSNMKRLFPDLEYGASIGPFEPAMRSQSGFMYMDVRVYQVRYGAEARP